MIEAEAWGMAVARRVTSAASTALLDLPGGLSVLAVERFDRVVDSLGIERVHQEDCAQALGLDPGCKYASTSTPKKSDPTYRAIAELLARYAVDPLEEQRKLLRSVFVTVIVGNTDAHAKNFALLHPDEASASLAPLYDVVPACEVTPETLVMGMRVGGRIRIDRVTAVELVEEARSWGVPERIAREELDEATSLLRQGIREASDLYPDAGARHAAPARARLAAFWDRA